MTSHPTAADSWISLGEARVRYRRAGKGETVLILHGWGASIEAMHMIFNDLARSFDACVMDLPGHGQSPAPAVPWTVSDYANLVRTFMKRLEIPRGHFVAHSFGCRVSIKIAAETPELVQRMLLTGAAGVPPRRTRRQRFRLALARAGKRVKALLGEGAIARWLGTRWIYYAASADYARATGVMRATLVNVVGEDLTASLPLVKAPTLLVWGDLDHDTPLSSGRLMQSRIPGSELVVLEGGGHFAYAEQYAKFRLHMLRFLRGE
jgi:pimeloyl-ACP methyl ester carboxylesterase